MRILMFEDERSILRPICIFLRAQGYEVFGFTSPENCPIVTGGKCGCTRKRACADILITDMNMPGMTGYELVSMLAEKCHGIPPQNMIVISATMAPEQRESCEDRGCQLLPKPFELGELLRVIRGCTGNILPGRELIPPEQLGIDAARPCAAAV
jgi:CheY-like chemotaxis protein